MAKAYVLLDLNGEYHGYDIFRGVFSTYEDALNYKLNLYGGWANEIGIVAYGHDHHETDLDCSEFDKPHTHVCLWHSNDGRGSISYKEYKQAVLDNEEENFDWRRDDVCVLQNFIIEEWEV